MWAENRLAQYRVGNHISILNVILWCSDMVTKRKLKDEIVKLNYRIEELEERLCPCGEHDWKQVDSYTTTFTNGLDFDIICKYKCKRCGKTKERLF